MHTRNHHALYIFLTISVSLHAIALIAWRATEPVARQSGDTILLTLSREPADAETVAAKTKAVATKATANRITPQRPVPQLKPQPAAHTSEPQQAVSEIAEYNADDQSPGQTQTKIVTAAEAAAATHEQGEFGPQIQAQLQLAIAPHFTYPMLARKKGWQGQVVLGLHINRAGQLSNIHILQSSGYGVLDRAALSTLEHIASVPEATQWLNQHGLDTEVPIDYQLADA